MYYNVYRLCVSLVFKAFRAEVIVCLCRSLFHFTDFNRPEEVKRTKKSALEKNREIKLIQNNHIYHINIAIFAMKWNSSFDLFLITYSSSVLWVDKTDDRTKFNGNGHGENEEDNVYGKNQKKMSCCQTTNSGCHFRPHTHYKLNLPSQVVFGWRIT